MLLKNWNKSHQANRQNKITKMNIIMTIKIMVKRMEFMTNINYLKWNCNIYIRKNKNNNKMNNKRL